MSEWYVIRHERPYDDEDAFVEAEGWALTSKSMVLVGHPDLNVDTQVRCYVTLASGTTLVKAEGIVLGYRASTEERPGGLEVRFKRIGSDTQRLIKRCTERHRPSPRARKQQYSLLDLELEGNGEQRVSLPGPEVMSIPAPESVRAAEPAPEQEPVSAPEPDPVPAPERSSPAEPTHVRAVPSGDRGSLEALRGRPIAPVNAPANRADLLERLRKRSSSS